MGVLSIQYIACWSSSGLRWRWRWWTSGRSSFPWVGRWRCSRCCKNKVVYNIYFDLMWIRRIWEHGDQLNAGDSTGFPRLIFFGVWGRAPCMVWVLFRSTRTSCTTSGSLIYGLYALWIIRRLKKQPEGPMGYPRHPLDPKRPTEAPFDPPRPPSDPYLNIPLDPIGPSRPTPWAPWDPVGTKHTPWPLETQ